MIKQCEEVRYTDGKRERERQKGETLWSSSFCYFNPDSALKYGHHVGSLSKKKNSASVSSQPIRGHKVHGGGTWGGSRSLRENVIKMCEHSRRVHGREAAFTGKLD